MLHVVHVITDLKVGGAQMMLCKLLSRMDRTQFRNSVISIGTEATLGGMIREHAALESVSFDRAGLPIGATARLTRLLRRARPDVVQTWMYHADLLGGVAARIGTGAPVLWNIRTSALGDSRWATRGALRLLAGLSRIVPFEIVSCSMRARDMLVALGYDRERFVIVPNGFDVERFRPDPEARAGLRRELGISGDAQLVGLVARWHPIKDHALFTRAARRIATERPDVHFVLCGDDVTGTNPDLRKLVEATGVPERIHLLGRREDVPRITSALDLACSSSSSVEAFSNAIGEAMACGVSAVATDVGDSAFIVGGTGRVVAPGDDNAFAEACLGLLGDPVERARLGAAARRRIVEHFEIGRVTRMYEDLYRRAARRERSAPSSTP